MEPILPHLLEEMFALVSAPLSALASILAYFLLNRQAAFTKRWSEEMEKLRQIIDVNEQKSEDRADALERELLAVPKLGWVDRIDERVRDLEIDRLRRSDLEVLSKRLEDKLEKQNGNMDVLRRDFLEEIKRLYDMLDKKGH